MCQHRSEPINHQVVVIGAGPVGLAAGARLLDAGIEPLVLEAGLDVGHTIRDWAHVRLFTDWRSVVDPAAAGLLEASGWVAPPAGEFPTGGELVDRYLEPLGAILADHIRFGHKVIAISRRDRDKMVTDGRYDLPFLVRVELADRVVDLTADNVIDASGTWSTPNPMGAAGLPAIGEDKTVNIRYGIPDVLGRERYGLCVVALLGDGKRRRHARGAEPGGR